MKGGFTRRRVGRGESKSHPQMTQMYPDKTVDNETQSVSVVSPRFGKNKVVGYPLAVVPLSRKVFLLTPDNR